MPFMWAFDEDDLEAKFGEVHDFKIIACWTREQLPVPVRFLKIATDGKCILVVYLKVHWKDPAAVQLAKFLEENMWKKIRVGFAEVVSSPIVATFVNGEFQATAQQEPRRVDRPAHREAHAFCKEEIALAISTHIPY